MEQSIEELTAHYTSFITDEQREFLQPTIQHLREISRAQKMDSDRYLEFLTHYIQTFPYDFRPNPSIHDTPRAPAQTIQDNKGICTDKTILFATMLSMEGYACAILHFERDNHACVGIPAPSQRDFKGCGYAVIETTNHSYIGGFPIALDGSHDLASPQVIPVGNGAKTYGMIGVMPKVHRMIETLKRGRKGVVTAQSVFDKQSLDFIRRKTPYTDWVETYLRFNNL